MEFFRIRKDIPFMRHALVFNIISALTFAAAVFFLLHRGLHYSVEFTGGTVMELRYQQPEASSFDTAHDVMLRLPVVKGIAPKDASAQVFDALRKAGNGGVTLQKTEFIGPQVGDELAQNGLTALVMVVIGVVIILGFFSARRWCMR